jgi:hypothetical protein
MGKRPRKSVGFFNAFTRAVEQFASATIKDAGRAERDAGRWATSLAHQAGLFPLGGTSRRFGAISTGETISERQGKRRIAEISPAQRAKERKFKRTLKQTGSVEKARQESGLSKRGFERVRAKTAVKKKGHYSFLPKPSKRKPHAHTEKLIVIQPGGEFVDVVVQGTDITKIRERNIAMAEARAKDDGSRNLVPLNRFMRKYKRHYVTDVETGEHVQLIMSREELDRSKAQMNMPTREEVDKRYAEDMADA